MYQSLLPAALVLLYLTDYTLGYCKSLGANPSFTETPIVTQLGLSRVAINWEGKVDRADCADQFVVKYWMRKSPNDYKMSEFVGSDQFQVEVDVIPRVEYEFQAIAREEKGWLLGVDYNKAPIVTFATSTKTKSTATRSGFAVYTPPDSPRDNANNTAISTKGKLEGEPDKTQPPPKDHTTMIIIVTVTCVAVVFMLILLCVFSMRCLRQYRDGPEEIEHTLN